MSELAQAYIGLGSNLDDPWAQLDRAVAALAQTPGINVRQTSSIYRTAPWGDTDQPAFLNAVVHIDTSLGPMQLLTELRRIEAAAGRRRVRRWGPRTLDLDLLVFADTVCDTAELQLPHPRMHTRAFVLVPLAELAPGLCLGEHGTVTEALSRVGIAGVERIVLNPDMT